MGKKVKRIKNNANAKGEEWRANIHREEEQARWSRGSEVATNRNATGF